MLPQIFVLGHPVAMYGLCILIGLAVGIGVAVLYGKREGLKAEDVIFASFFGVLGLAAGGKLLYLGLYAKQIWKLREVLFGSLEQMTGLFTNGFVFYGGLLGAVVMLWIYCRKYRIVFTRMVYVILPSIPLAHAFGRVGCFFAGCCYGIPYMGLGHVVFTRAVAAPNGIGLFPVQLAEALWNILLFVLLCILVQKGQSVWRVAGSYCLLYGIGRFCLEFLRGDAVRGFYGEFSTSQWFSLLLCGIGIGLFICRSVSCLINQRHRERLD